MIKIASAGKTARRVVEMCASGEALPGGAILKRGIKGAADSKQPHGGMHGARSPGTADLEVGSDKFAGSEFDRGAMRTT